MAAVKKVAVLLLLGLMAGQEVSADDDSFVQKVGKGIKKGGEAVGYGVEKGIEATSKGLKKGAEETGKGLKMAGDWIEKKVHKDGNKDK